LEIPALNEVALWLRGQKEDFFLEILRRGRQADFRTLRSREYLLDLSQAMEASYVFSDTSTRVPGNGNDLGK
jgi:hypothetical protein